MKLLKVELKAGIPLTIGRGRFVRLLEAAFPVEIETQALETKGNEGGTLVSNVGAEFVPFERATLTSEKDQQITIAYSELQIYDNRLGVNGALIVESVPRGAALTKIAQKTLNSGRIELLAADSRRRTALLSTSSTIKVFTANSGGVGFTIDGVLEHESQAPLYAEGSGEVEILEYLN